MRAPIAISIAPFLRCLTAATAFYGASLALSGTASATPSVCPAPSSAPADVQQRYTDLGGTATLGCLVSSSNGAYKFRFGQIIEMSAQYGGGSTFAVTCGRDPNFHLFWNQADTGNYDANKWLVRLSWNDTFINQVAYPIDGKSVGGNYGSNVIVHPGGRRGTFEIAIESCIGGDVLSGNSECLGWNTIVQDLY